MIQLTGISKQYNQKSVLNIPQLVIQSGESVGILGSNGSGKSTLLKILVALLKPTEGEVTWWGESAMHNEKWRKRVGCFLDDDGLINFLTPDEYFRLTAGLRGIGPTALIDFYSQMDSFFAGEILGPRKYINDLSSGNRQKVGVAAALLADLEVLILDEPFAHLDTQSQNFLAQHLKQRANTQNRTMIITSHDMSMIQSLCGRIITLDNGKIVGDLKI